MSSPPSTPQRLVDTVPSSLASPGGYNIREEPGTQCPAYSIKGRHPQKNNYGSPVGPGAYNTQKDKILNAAPSYSISAKKPSSIGLSKNKVPGPGEYSLPSTISTNKGFSLAARTTTPSSQSNPSVAPSTYSPSVSYVAPRSPAYSLAGRLQSSPTSSTDNSGLLNTREDPGKSSPVRRNSPAYSIRPKTKLPSDHDNTPSAGQYSPNSKSVLPSSPAYSLKSRKKTSDNSSNQTPGPQYNTSSQIGSDSPAFSFKGKSTPAKTTDLNTPGSGAYNVNTSFVKNSAPAYSLAARTTLPSDSLKTPAPGEYDIPSSIETKKGFSVAVRTNIPNGSTMTPSPSDYNPSTSFVKSSTPKYSLAGRHQSRTFDNSPAPSSYNPKTDFTLKQSPAYSMRGASPSRQTRRAERKEVGPGDYDLGTSFGTSKSKISLKHRH
ncbi:hypothetical protein RCL1_002123 [Eukaryota sp. TZLM3-RCL]